MLAVMKESGNGTVSRWYAKPLAAYARMRCFMQVVLDSRSHNFIFISLRFNSTHTDDVQGITKIKRRFLFIVFLITVNKCSNININLRDPIRTVLACMDQDPLNQTLLNL